MTYSYRFSVHGQHVRAFKAVFPGFRSVADSISKVAIVTKYIWLISQALPLPLLSSRFLLILDAFLRVCCSLIGWNGNEPPANSSEFDYYLSDKWHMTLDQAIVRNTTRIYGDAFARDVDP